MNNFGLLKDGVPYTVKYGTPNAACFDIESNADVKIHPFEVVKIPTGLYLDDSWSTIEGDYYLQIVPRSGLASKGLTIVNSPGIVDPDYRGEIQIIMTYLSYTAGGRNFIPFEIKKGDRIAQAMPVPFTKMSNRTVLNNQRSGGFGSTGV